MTETSESVRVLQAIKNVIAGDGIAPDKPLTQLRYIVFDTEFTSLDSRTNRLLSIGAVVMDGAKIRMGEQFYRVTNPGVDLPEQSVIVHKLRTEDIECAEEPREVLAGFLHFIEGAVLVGHFIRHDLEILEKELVEARLDRGACPRAHIDTARLFHWNELHRRHYPVEAFDERTIKLDLASVAAHYAVAFAEAHHALADAFVTAQIWQKQIAILRSQGVETWKQLRRIAR